LARHKRNYVFNGADADAILRAAMVALTNTGSDARTDGDPAPVRTIIVAGQSSPRTREVLHALRGFTNVIWPTSLESALAQTQSVQAGCLVIADDLREEPIDEFLQEARELRRNLPIFVITDPDDVAEAVSAMRHGATKVIEIPPSYAALCDEVKRAMQ
jgi:FixJ family two-component response regulator